MFDCGELRLVLLKLIADEPRHGYDLIRQVEELTSGAYAPSPGVIYPTLTLLDDMGQIAVQQSEGARKLFAVRSEEHTSELQSLMRISYAVFCLKQKKSKYTLSNDIHYTTTSIYPHKTTVRYR